MQKIYAQALDTMSHLEGADTKKLVSMLTKHLEASGRTKLLPKILRELRVIEARRLKLTPRVEVSSETESPHALRDAQKMGVEVKHAIVNHSLIKGWRASSGSTLIDRSAKRALIDLYREITS